MKHFEHHPFVTDDFPKSMLARKTQIMLADLLSESASDLLSERTRTIPRWVAYYWRNSFGKRPKLLQLDFVMVLSLIVVLALFVAGFVEKIFRRETILEIILPPVIVAVPMWAAFATLLSWTRRLDEELTLSSRRNRWFQFTWYAVILAFVWISPVAFIVYFILYVPVVDPEFMAIKYLWYVILGIVLVVWTNHIFEAYRDIRYTHHRVEPTLRAVLGFVVLTCGFALAGGSSFLETFVPAETPLIVRDIRGFRDIKSEEYPTESEIKIIQLSTEVDSFQTNNQVDWYRFVVEDVDVYRISVNADLGDPTMALFGPNEILYLTEDDDGGVHLNSEIHEILKQGTYFIAVREYLGMDLDYSIELTRPSMVDQEVRRRENVIGTDLEEK